MTVWDLKALCEQKIKDEQLTEEQRNAWQNALKSVEINLKERSNEQQNTLWNLTGHHMDLNLIKHFMKKRKTK